MLLSQLNDYDYSYNLTKVRAELSVVFAKYDAKFSSVRMQRAATPDPTGKERTAWGKIFGNDATVGFSSAAGLGSRLGSGLGGSSSLHRRSSASAQLQAATSGASLAAASELSAYLDSDTVNQYDDDFNVLH